MKKKDHAELFELCPISRARLNAMRYRAKARNKRAPTLEHLAWLATTHCPECGVKYDSTKTKGSAPSLQHWEDGRTTIICHACNARHGNMKRPELFGKIPNDMKHCAPCNTIQPKTNFHRNPDNKDGLTASCKTCKNTADRQRRKNRKQPRQPRTREHINRLHRQWEANHREQRNAAARARAAKKRVSAQRDQAATNQDGATLTGSAPRDRDPKT